MKLNVTLLLSLILLFAHQHLYAQNEAYIDSLKKALETHPADSDQAVTYFELAKINTRTSFSVAIDYAEKGYEFGLKTDHPKGIIGNLGIMGYSYMALGKYDSSEIFYQKRLEHSERLKQVDQVGASYANLGMLAYRKEQLEKAIELTLKGLKVYEELNNIGEQARILNSLSIFMENAGDLKQSEEYALKSLKLKEEVNDETGLARGYANLGGFYTDQERYEEALENLKKSEILHKKLGYEAGLVFVYTNMGMAYDKLKKHKIAQNYHEKSLELCYKVDDVDGISLGLENLGENLMHQGKYKEAISYLQKSLEQAEKIDYIQNEPTLYKAMAKAYSKTGNYAKAYEFSDRFATLKDSLNTAQNTKAISEMQTKYETEKKNQQIELLTKENEIKSLSIKNQQLFNYALIGFLALTGILAFVIWNRYQLKTKTSALLADKNMELEKLNATKDKLFALVAHDLKNPLSAFRSITQSLSTNLVNISKSDIEYFLEELNKSANSLYDLLQNLLSWAISQIDQLPYKPEKLSLQPLLNENIDLLALNAKEKNVELTYELNGLDSVLADKNMLRTVLRNLIGNAIKFTPEGGQVTVIGHQIDNYTHIEVKDNGVGISESDMNKLFKVEEDVSTIGVGEGKGTGLGLILCKELMEKQGGSISVESKLGEGSSFIVKLPTNKNQAVVATT